MHDMILVQYTTLIGAVPLQLDFGELRVPPPLEFDAAFVDAGRRSRGRKRSRGFWRRGLSATVAELAPEARKSCRSQCGRLTCMAYASACMHCSETWPMRHITTVTAKIHTVPQPLDTYACMSAVRNSAEAGRREEGHTV